MTEQKKDVQDIIREVCGMNNEELYNEVIALAKKSPATDKVGAVGTLARGGYAVERFWDEKRELEEARNLEEKLGELADILYYYATALCSANEGNTLGVFREIVKGVGLVVQIMVATHFPKLGSHWERAYALTVVKYRLRQKYGKNTSAENEALLEVYSALVE